MYTKHGDKMSSSGIDISIIIISYNERPYLKAAVNSCLTQRTSYKYEIIIGDDGSNDGSLETIREIVSENNDIVSYFVMDRDGIEMKNLIPSLRVSRIIKEAYKRASGKYLCILSGDDLIVGAGRIQKQLDFLKNNPDYSSCFSDFYYMYENGDKRYVKTTISISNKVLWRCFYYHISCFVFDRDCMNKLTDRFCDDAGLVYSILCSGRSKHLRFIGFGYRQREKSIMHEADKIESSIVNILVCQDCLNAGCFKSETIARFSKDILLINKNQEIVANTLKYAKYLRSGEKYNNNILGLLVNHGDSKGDFKYINNIVRNASIYRLINFISKGALLIIDTICSMVIW